MEPLRANSRTDTYFYLKVTPCAECSQGPWELDQPAPPAEGTDPPDLQRLRARCVHCGARREFAFRCDASAEVEQIEDLSLERVNPTDEPSELIDLGQWLSLFYMLAESASKATDKALGRRLTFQTTQCLDEALKFYLADDDLPPETAFFTERSRQAFAEHPEKFARETLRLMRRKLPDLNFMVRRLSRDAAGPAPRRWWQFWKNR